MNAYDLMSFFLGMVIFGIYLAWFISAMFFVTDKFIYSKIIGAIALLLLALSLPLTPSLYRKSLSYYIQLMAPKPCIADDINCHSRIMDINKDSWDKIK